MSLQLNGAMTFITSNLKDLQSILPQAVWPLFKAVSLR